MGEWTRSDVVKHLSRLANSTGEEYQKERDIWDGRSTGYAWALIQLLDAATARQGQSS